MYAWLQLFIVANIVYSILINVFCLTFKYNNHMFEVITGEHLNFGRLEYWTWFFPHPNYDPVNNGRIHIIGKFYWRK